MTVFIFCNITFICFLPNVFRKWISLSFTSFFFSFILYLGVGLKGEICYRCFLHHFTWISNQWGHELGMDGSVMGSCWCSI